MTGRIPRRHQDGKWEYTSAAAAREYAGFEAMRGYIRKRQNISTQFIATQSILDLCEETERTPWVQVGIRWW